MTRARKVRAQQRASERSSSPLLLGEGEALFQKVGHADALGHSKALEFFLEIRADLEIERRPLLGSRPVLVGGCRRSAVGHRAYLL